MFNEFHFSKLCPFFCRRSPPPTRLPSFARFFCIVLVDGRFEFCPLWRFVSSFFCRLLTLTFTKWPLGDEWQCCINVSISCHVRPCSVAIWTCASSIIIACPPHSAFLHLPNPRSPLLSPLSPLTAGSWISVSNNKTTD